MTQPATYAIALLHDVQFGADLVAYLQRIDATLEPFGGRFVVHQAAPTLVEGSLEGRTALIVIGFPDRASATAWYESPEYRDILPLRTRNSRGFALLADAVPDGYTAAAGLRAWLGG